MLSDNWTGLYREGWGSRLCPPSYSHPAKAAYALTVRIYEHALEEGWIEPGQYVVDPFGGIGGFALEAMRNGLHFIGSELEQRFVDMGQGCDCTGISKEDWARYQGRWDRMRYKGGRHWCPECLMKASAVNGEWKSAIADKRKIKPLPLPGTKWAALAKMRQVTVFDAAPTASYVRNSGKVPCTGVHHYRGNIETWEQDGMAGTAVIVQGDSRRLGEVLARARLCLSSPPYAGSIHKGGHGIDAEKLTGNKAGLNSQALIMDGYGREPGQLAALPEGDHAEACERPVIAISSPPFLGVLHQSSGGMLAPHQSAEHGRDEQAASVLAREYGQADGQLGAMPTGSHAEALEAGAVTPACADRGQAQAVISSPPYAQSELAQASGGDIELHMAQRNSGGRQYNRHNPANLGNETGSTFWAASREILEQVYQVLAPGGHAIWVLKMFVRSGRLVDFPGQWEQLCQSVGFKTVCKHRAWMNKNTGIVQTTLDGEEMSMEKWYKSFFRILCEKKGAPRIDWELILCMVKE